jgi:hypothetical protein
MAVWLRALWHVLGLGCVVFEGCRLSEAERIASTLVPFIS